MIANPQTSVIFLIGSDKPYSIDIRQRVKQEHEKYGDLIMAEELIEHYDNLTLKTLYTLKFFIEKGKKNHVLLRS